MNADLTVSTLTFSQVASDIVGGSLRRDTSRGLNLPTELTVRHQSYVDSATKLPGKRSVVRFDRHVALSTGAIAPVSAYLVVTAPTDTAITSSDITAAVGYINGLIDATSPNLDLVTNLFVNKEQ